MFTRFGDHNRVEGGFDFSGPVDKNGELLYRITGIGRKSDTDVNYQTTERYAIAPSITWRPTTDTTLTVRGSYDHDPSSYQPNWLPALGTLQKNPNGQIPRDFFSGNPNYNRYDREQTSVGYEFEHRFDEVFTARQNFRYMEVTSDFKALSVPPGGAAFGAGSTCGAGTTTNLCLARSSTHYLENLRAATVDNQLEAKFNTGWLQHTLLVGLDYQWSTASATYGNGATTYVNFLNPKYASIPEPVLNSRQNQGRDQAGLYAQDQIRLGKLVISAGVRNDWANTSSDTTVVATRTSVRTSDSAPTWRTGATYLFDNGLAPYVSYSTSFEPTIGTSYTGAAFLPTKGEQYEGGIKYQPLGFNGYFMLSYYDLTQSNVLTPDTAHSSAAFPVCTAASGSCQMQLGEVHSKGVELSGKATLWRGLDMVASYAHNDIVTTRSAQPGVQGKVPVGAPSDTASLWLDYTMQGGALSGFGFGGGVRYIGSSYGDLTNTAAIVVPSFTLMDAAIHYDLGGLSPQLRGWKAAVNMTNVFDKYYVSACASANQCFIGNGRSTMGTLRYQW